jgi:hypothetical protein
VDGELIIAVPFLTILTNRNLPKIIRQSRDPEPSTINGKTIADFTRVVEQTGILKCQAPRVSVSLIMCTDGAGAPTGSGIVPAARWRFDSASPPVPTGILLLERGNH